MYWADSGLMTIEAAYLNGTGRRTLLTEWFARYFGFALYDGNIYFTDRSQQYVGLYFLIRPGRGMQYCDESVRLSVCLSVHITRKPHDKISPNFVHIACGRGSVLL